MPEVYVALGSNVEPEKHLALASRELDRAFPGARFSSWYRNAAVGFQGEDFINSVAVFPTDLPLSELLPRLHAIEALCGRPREAPRWAPRTMDIDVLLYGSLICQEPQLPRPDLLKRAYMLGPLAELAPDVLHPVTGLSIGDHWQRFDREAHVMQRLEPRLHPG
jgi:2-amino-4-hydroxy-6-hydroxymethyldihydropteridine diphosphokinase